MKRLDMGSTFPVPKRKAPGKVGRRIIVESNHLPLTLKNPKMIVYHYDVSIDPEKPYRIYRFEINLIL